MIFLILFSFSVRKASQFLSRKRDISTRRHHAGRGSEEYDLLQPQSDMPGVSIVAACRNRHEELRHSLSTWTNVDGANEIIIVDWASTPPLSFVIEEVDGIDASHIPVIVLRMANESSWKASQAFNVGFRASHFTKILRLDCDYHVHKDFVSSHPLGSDQFNAGGIHLERMDEDEGLRNLLYAEKEILLSVGGYDERLQEYGGEQADLITRLTMAGYKRIDARYEKLSHSAHSIKSKRLGATLDIEGALNLEILKKLPPWNSSGLWTDTGRSRLRPNIGIKVRSFRHQHVTYVNMNASISVLSVRNSLPGKDLVGQRERITREYLHAKFAFPICLSKRMAMSSLRVLVGLLSKQNTQQRENHGPSTFIVHCISNFAARLRLLVSGLSFAKQTGRSLIVLWETNSNSPSRLSDLVVPSGYFSLEGINNSTEPCRPSSDESFASYSFLKGAEGEAHVIRNGVEQHIYVKADSPFISDNRRLVNPISIRASLKNIIPHQRIRERLQALEDDGLNSSLGVYISSTSAKPNPLKDLSIFAEVQQRLSEIQRKQHTAPKVFLIAHGRFKKRFQMEGLHVLSSSPAARYAEDKIPFEDDFISTFALCRVNTFLSFSERGDDFSNFIHLLRGEHN